MERNGSNGLFGQFSFRIRLKTMETGKLHVVFRPTWLKRLIVLSFRFALFWCLGKKNRVRLSWTVTYWPIPVCTGAWWIFLLLHYKLKLLDFSPCGKQMHHSIFSTPQYWSKYFAKFTVLTHVRWFHTYRIYHTIVQRTKARSDHSRCSSEALSREAPGFVLKYLFSPKAACSIG